MSPYEVAARERKAAKIADHILGCFREAGGRIEPQPIATLVLELRSTMGASATRTVSPLMRCW